MPAYLLTWTTYGTWLHGDRRGSVDRDHNTRGTPIVAPDARLRSFRASLAKHPPLRLDHSSRSIVEDAIREASAHRNWLIRAISVRSNHVHAVIEAEHPPERVLADLKARATRALREQGAVEPDRPAWTHHGSTRWLKTERSLHRALDYVHNEQDAQTASPERQRRASPGDE